MQEENIVDLLYSRKPRRLAASFFREIPEADPAPGVREWHEQHCEQHAYREILLVLTGSVSQRLNDAFYQIPADTLLLIDRRERHSWGYNAESEGLHCWIVLLPGKLLWNFVSCKNGEYGYVRRGGLARSELYDALERCWESCSGESPAQEKAAQVAELSAIMSLILVAIGRQMSEFQLQRRLSNEENARVVIQQVAAHVHDCCGCTVTDMARMAGYSQVHFVRLFRRFTGMRPKEYIRMIRFRKYAELHGKIPVKQLAGELGFGSSSALNHWLTSFTADRTVRTSEAEKPVTTTTFSDG